MGFRGVYKTDHIVTANAGKPSAGERINENFPWVTAEKVTSIDPNRKSLGVKEGGGGSEKETNDEAGDRESGKQRNQDKQNSGKRLICG